MKFLANRNIFIKSSLKKPANMLKFAAAAGLFAGLAILITQAGYIYRRTEKALEMERRNQSKENAVSFSRAALQPRPNQNVQIVQSAKNTRAVARFQKSIFAATDGGLLQMSENGEILRHFTVLDGLPESDLTALAVFGSKLFIGTKSKGLISFDGEKFEAFRLENHETKSITALFHAPNRLLIGTFSGGLIEFDGDKITEIKPFDSSINHITFLREDDSGLIVGTFADGLWMRKNQVWKQFTTADGLSSNRVLGVENFGGSIFVATDLGVSQAVFEEILQENQKTFRQTFGLPTLSSLMLVNETFYLTKDNGEIFEFSSKRHPAEPSTLKKIGWKAPENLQSARFFRLDNEIWFLSSAGLYKNKNSASGEISLAVFTKDSDENFLTDNNVSALLIDRRARLWVGTFRRGIDVFSDAGKKLEHLESENVREINNLTSNAENEQVIAATSAGAMLFDEQFKETFFTENENLPNRSVTQISLFNDGKNRYSAVSTAKGLFFQDKNSRRVFSTLNGLPSGSVFAALFARNSLFAATMSGLAQIENGRVARVFKTSNSELKNNWISALCPAGERIFIGTYGGGVFELLPSGEIRGFESETEKFFVNPNALFSDGARLYAGTLEGVWCLDLQTQKWSRIKDFLPSETVLSITGDGENIYFGTTNGIARINRNFWIEN